LIYIGIIDTLYNLPYTPIPNLLFIDRDEWIIYDTTFWMQDTTHVLEAKFNFNIQALGPDSIMFRTNGDCNRDGKWDIAEVYYDYGSDWCPDNMENGDGKDKVEKCNARLFGGPCDCLDAIDPNYVEGSDPNGDNWMDCGWDTKCSNDLGYTGADFNGTENNGIWDQNEELEGNLQYDLGEHFVDIANGVIDRNEFFFDADSNGEFDEFTEPYEDRNCNGVLDEAEIEDVGNGIWDDSEKFTDTNGDGDWDEGEPLYVISTTPSSFLVDYPDQNLDNGVGIKTFTPDTTITLFVHYDDAGNPQFESYDSLIIMKADSTTRRAVYADIDSIVTVYSNRKIESLSGAANDYHVTKTKWFEPVMDDLAVDTIRNYDYDYHIFKISIMIEIFRM
jgi:hypothetical protein